MVDIDSNLTDDLRNLSLQTNIQSEVATCRDPLEEKGAKIEVDDREFVAEGTTLYDDKPSTPLRSPIITDQRTPPSLRKQSAYCAQGKLDESRRQRRISWSPAVLDNAKGPGEESLSAMIKRRAQRQKASHHNLYRDGYP